MSCISSTVLRPNDGRLASRYGIRQGRTTGRPTMHAGIDIIGPTGTPIYAPVAGVVERVARNTDGGRAGGFRGYGNAVVLRHGDGRWSFYAHMREALVSEGMELEPGQQIGAIGNTTNGKFPGMGAHLHMEVRHAKEDGSSPFPGAYASYNEDPQSWLSAYGLGFSRDGLTADPTLGACTSPPMRALDRLSPLYSTGSDGLLHRGTRGLGRLGDVDAGVPRDAGPEKDPNEDYEPPVPDPDFYRGAPLWVHVAGALGLAAIGGAGLFLGLRST